MTTGESQLPTRGHVTVYVEIEEPKLLGTAAGSMNACHKNILVYQPGRRKRNGVAGRIKPLYMSHVASQVDNFSLFASQGD